MHPFYGKVTDRARKSLELANDFCKRERHPLVTNLHILWGLVEEDRNVASQVLKNLKIEPRVLKDRISKTLGNPGYMYGYKSHGHAAPYAEDACKAIVDAIDQCVKGNSSYIGCQHLLLAIMADRDNSACRLLEMMDVTQELVMAEIKAIVKPL